MMKLLFKLLYRLGLRKDYTKIDRLHYLKRLRKGRHRADGKYFSSRDPEQFVQGNEVCITDDFRGTRVAFLCDSRHHFEQLIIRQGFSGHAVLDHMAAWSRPGTIVIDVGANVGAYCVPLAAARPDVVVHAFEANPLVAARMSVNAALNRLANLTVHSSALADAKGVMEFYQFDDDISLSSLSRHAAEIHGVPKRSQVPVETIDDLFTVDGPQLSVVKIDVQGVELRVLRGAKKLIAAHHPVILFEHEDAHFESPEQASAEKVALAGFFDDQAYRCFYLSRYDPKMLFPVEWSRPLHGDVLALPLAKKFTLP